MWLKNIVTFCQQYPVLSPQTRLEHVLKFHKKRSFIVQDLAVVLYRCRSLDLMRVLYERFMLKLKLRCEHIVE